MPPLPLAPSPETDSPTTANNGASASTSLDPPVTGAPPNISAKPSAVRSGDFSNPSTGLGKLKRTIWQRLTNASANIDGIDNNSSRELPMGSYSLRQQRLDSLSVVLLLPESSLLPFFTDTDDAKDEPRCLGRPCGTEEDPAKTDLMDRERKAEKD
jgi:hypothetical protein